MKKYNVAIVGATGAVGLEMINMIEVRQFPVNNLRLFASERSKGKKLKFKNQNIIVEELTHSAVKGLKNSIDLALFSAGASISKEYAKEFNSQDIFVIDNSSAWRMDPEIPLVVPEVNSHQLTKDTKLIANPNCSTIQMIVVLSPIHKVAKIKRIIVSTYQSTSGAGGKAMQELHNQTKLVLNNLEKFDRIIDIKPDDYILDSNISKVLPYQIAFNLIPQIDIFLENLYTKEEMKMVQETKKILDDPNLKISATCVRVPVLRGHSESVWIETEKKVSVSDARNILQKADGVVVLDNILEKKYPMPIYCANQQITYVGRIREDISTENSLVMWIVSDNLLKGAALNAVQIAEKLLEKGYF